jgi:hypothetical protein
MGLGRLVSTYARVFHVGTLDESSVFCQETGTNPKLGVRRVGGISSWMDVDGRELGISHLDNTMPYLQVPG